MRRRGRWELKSGRPRCEIADVGQSLRVINRGNHRRGAFAGSGAAEALERASFEAAGQYGWKVHAYMVMRNHDHLALKTPGRRWRRGCSGFQGACTQGLGSERAMQRGGQTVAGHLERECDARAQGHAQEARGPGNTAPVQGLESGSRPKSARRIRGSDPVARRNISKGSFLTFPRFPICIALRSKGK